MGQRAFVQYWWMVLVKAAERAWDKLGAWGTFIGIATPIIVVVLAKHPKSFAEFWRSDAVMTAVLIVCVMALVLVVYIVKEPVVIHNTQEDEKDSLLKKIRAYENPSPNVVAQDVLREDIRSTMQARTWTTPTGNTDGTIYPTTDSILEVPDSTPKTYGPNYERYYVPFRNLPTEGKRIRDAIDVHAVTSIRGDNNWTCLHEAPRWLGQPVPGKTQPSIVISSNGEVKGLYLVIREKGQEDFYVFNDRSYTDGHINPDKAELKLVGNSFNFNIRLRDKDGWYKDYEIKMTVDNHNPTFEMISA